MKQKKNFAQIVRQLSIISLIFFACIVSARAQVRPFVDCVESVDANNYRVYFGYVSLFTVTVVYPRDAPNNYFSPAPDPSGQPFTFLPGVHHRAVAVVIPNATNETWILGASYSTSSFTPEMLCGADGANSRAFTYQGRLTDANMAANGAYDLRFQLFNAATDGTARTTTLDVDDVTVTNGIFTVTLDFGAISLPPGIYNPNTTPYNLGLNPAILDAENTFVEIGVRAGNSTGAYTTLNPRQPLTAVPLAMKANTANNAFRAANADKLGGVLANQFVQTSDARLSDARTPTAGSGNYIQNTTTQQTGNFNVSGNGTIGGTLTANTTNISGATNQLLNVQSSSAIGTWLTLDNTTTGGRRWSVISTGASNGEGAGKLLFYDRTIGTGRLLLSDTGANITGNLTVSGSISGATKNFKIDHPLDPLNKTLTYTSVESPDMMNIYNGNATTDANGEAIVTMPSYFEALNKDFRYQLTVIGQFAQAIVSDEITGNTFKIKTDKPNVKVSWQVTGIRHDKFAEDKQTNVEENKSAADKGKCLYAPACGNKERK